MSNKRAEFRRQQRATEDQTKHMYVSQAQLTKMIKDTAIHIVKNHEFHTSEKMMRIYRVAISIALQKEGWGARGTRMQRFFTNVNDIMHELSRLIDRTKTEDILEYCDKLGIDAEDAFGLKRECQEIMTGDELEIILQEESEE